MSLTTRDILRWAVVPTRRAALAIAVCAGFHPAILSTPAVSAEAGVTATASAGAPRATSPLPHFLSVSDRTSTHLLSGVAIEGHDPVSYFVEGEPRAGASRHEVIHRGVAWRFASAANRAAFLDAPDLYAPRFGGYDADALAEGLAVRAKPEIFAIIRNRLYLFRSEQARENFLADNTRRDRAQSAWLRMEYGLRLSSAPANAASGASAATLQ